MKTTCYRDGKWVEAEPIPYYPSIFEKMVTWIKRMFKKGNT